MTESKKPKILIVDDEEKKLKVMGIILHSRNYDFELARNGVKNRYSALQEICFV